MSLNLQIIVNIFARIRKKLGQNALTTIVNFQIPASGHMIWWLRATIFSNS